MTTYTSKRGNLYFIYPSQAPYRRGFDWHADDYDGAPDSGDNRLGWGVPSIEDAIEEIEEEEDFGDYGSL